MNPAALLIPTLSDSIEGTIPAAVCTIATIDALSYLKIWLYSLALWNASELQSGQTHAYIMGDAAIVSEMSKCNYLWLHIIGGLDSYSHLGRKQMLEMPATVPALLAANRSLWDQFQLEKTTVLANALRERPNALFTDSDITFMAPLRHLPAGYNVILAPHYIRRNDENRFGRFNGGWVWVNSILPLATWRRATRTSRFHEQAALEELTVIHQCAALPPTEDFGWWRLYQSDKSPQKQAELFGINNGILTFAGEKLTSVHTHFAQPGDRFVVGFNNLILRLLEFATDIRAIALREFLKTQTAIVS